MLDINTIKEHTEKVIEDKLPEAEGYAAPVIEAMNYAVGGGGKRLRPLLMYLTFRTFGNAYSVADDAVECFMAAIEMIHCYSLVHDDILDNDDLRRGKPSCHKKFGKDMALLAGDGLLNYAYEVAAGAMDKYPGNKNIEKAYIILTRKPGLYGMLGGQTADVHLTGKPLDMDQLEYIYRNKTSALIECAIMIGAILAELPDAYVELLERAAYKIGMAFQVRDDILDIEGNEELLGKTVGQDETNDKYTFPRVYGMEYSKKYVEETTDDALSLIDEVKNTCTGINEEYYDILISTVKSLVNREY